MDKPRIIDYYERVKENLEKCAKEEGKELNYDVETEMQKEYDNIMSGRSPSLGAKQKQKKIAKAQEIKYGLDYLQKQKETKNFTKTGQGTIRQIAMSIYFMRQANMFPQSTGTSTIDAEYIQFFTGHNKENLRKDISNPFRRSLSTTKKAVQSLIADVKTVIFHFEKIQFQAGIDIANKMLQKLENDLDSFENP